MRVIKTKSYEGLSKLAANMIGAQVLLKPNCTLGLATGSSPIGTYKELVEMNKVGILDFSEVKTVNLDEYCGLSGTHEQSYRYFMNENLFDHINIKKENTYVPNGVAENIDAECDAYEDIITSIGGVDLQLLGIGLNGHIAFNEPDSTFPARAHEVALTESTIKANSRLFEKEDDVPRTAITMGIGTIMKAERIVLIAGAEKADIIDKAINGPITPEVPASVLQMHRDVTIIISE